MSSKSQRRKQKQRQEQRKRLKQRQRKRGVAAPSNVELRQQIERQQPRAWDGEVQEDVAIFDDVLLESLATDLAGQANAVREGLLHACESRTDAALKCVSEIPRNSPYSQWRLFIRGFVLWMQEDWDAAEAAWKRLDPERRAGRMAVSMMSASRSDLPTSVSNAQETTTWSDRLDEPLLKKARMLRRLRFDRAAIIAAEVGIRAPDPRDLLIGPKKIKWLKSFAAENRATEPELVASLEQVALARAFSQNYSDLFEDAVSSFVGPRHDPKNLLLSFFFYEKFEDDSEDLAEARLKKYLKDLPRNELLPVALPNAIISQIHLNQARMKIRPNVSGIPRMMMGWLGPEDSRSIKAQLEASAAAYPANRLTYQEHVTWINSKLDNERLTKPQRKPYEQQLLKVMQRWSDGLPDDVEPRLWLIDYLLENEDTEAAQPHVTWMQTSRQADPRVRAAPWKWQILEAMRLCRRKAWLAEVPSKLDEALAVWPTWLSKQWFFYLKAVWLLRCGELDAFEQARAQLPNEAGVGKGSLADHCMMLGAAQRMRIAGADLKPLRGPVDAALKNIKSLKTDDLLCVAGFFWDLHRTKLLYPAYRMHGGKFAKELLVRWNANHHLVLDNLDDPATQRAVLLFSEHRFWSSGYTVTLPKWYDDPAVRKHPIFLAARVQTFVTARYHWRADKYAGDGETLREAATTQSDAYFRHWFTRLADELDEVFAKNDKFSPLGGLDSFASTIANLADDIEDEDEDEDDEYYYDPECDCADCRAARRRSETASWIS